ESDGKGIFVIYNKGVDGYNNPFRLSLADKKMDYEGSRKKMSTPTELGQPIIPANYQGDNVDTPTRKSSQTKFKEIKAKYDAKYVDAVKKDKMTKEQAMQALEEVGRKNSSAYAEIAALEQAQPTASQQPNITVKPGVSELFESNPELANEVYEALGFGQLKEPKVNDIVTLEFHFEKEDKIVPVKVKITELEKFYQGASTTNDNQGNIIKQEKGTLEYFLTLEKLDGSKKYEVSVGEDGYINQFVGGTGKTRVGTNNYIPEFDLSKSPITTEQKQEAQAKFQEYVNTTGKQDIEGFKEF